MEVGKAAQMMIDFGERHEKCKKTWQEPSPEETKGMRSMQDKMQWWIANGEQGVSSKTMYSVLSGHSIMSSHSYNTPSDPDDFRRCYLLLKAIPEFVDMLPNMKSVRGWSALVDNWDRLTEMLEEQMKTKEDNGMYDFMQSLINIPSDGE